MSTTERRQLAPLFAATLAGLGLAAPQLARADASAGTTNSVEAGLRRVQDELEIGQLRARYCHLLDDRKWDAFIDLFMPDGTFQGLKRVQGHDQLMEFFSKEFPALAEDWYHFCMNGTVEVNGDSGTGRITLLYLSVIKGVSYVSAGHYDDEFQRMNGAWKFKSRVITFYFLSPLSQGWAGRPFPGRKT